MPDRLPNLPYSCQTIDATDAAALREVLASGWIARGPRIAQFEKQLADYCGARHAVAVCNGSAGLHLAGLALGLGPGQSGWTSSISFVASANCLRLCGAEAGFVDIDPDTANLSLADLTARLEAAAVAGNLPRVLVPVHFAGQACPLAEIGELAQRYGFRVIEDACHALGGSYRGEKIGNCRYSDLTVFSFHPVKSITTGEGGAILTNSDELAARLRRLRHNGLVRDTAELREPSPGPWYMEQQELGFNYWLTDLQCALGLSQFARLDQFVARRRELADLYARRLAESGLPVRLLSRSTEAESAHHLLVIRLDLGRIKPTRREVFERLQAAGIGVQVHYYPIPAQPYYRSQGTDPQAYPEAWRYYEEALSLPLYPALKDADVERVVGALREALV